jgi:hypothetical protein
MAQKLAAALPPSMELEFNYTLEWAALDPVTGNPVAGVVVSQATLLVNDLVAGDGSQLAVGPFVLVNGPAS